MILCGGKGERLKPLTDALPKPLVHLRGRPILCYVLSHLKKYGIEDVVIAAGFQKDKIHEFFDSNYHELNVKIVDSGDVDIIERIKACAAHISGDFVLLYGDTIANVNLEHLQEFHFSHELKATTTLVPFKSQFGLFELNQEKTVIRFREKPTLDQLINIGFCYFESEIFSWIKNFTTYIDFLGFVANQNKMKGFLHHGVHLTVNTLQELGEAEQVIDKFEV